MRGLNKIIFLGVNLIFGLYLMNYALNFIKIDEVISRFDPWIIWLLIHNFEYQFLYCFIL